MKREGSVYKVVIWAFFDISLWKEKVALNSANKMSTNFTFLNSKRQAWPGIVKKSTMQFYVGSFN